MNHIVMLVLATCWVGSNIYLWSMKQSQLILVSQSLGMAAVGYPALYWYVARRRR
jgi:hypothetical protein